MKSCFYCKGRKVRYIRDDMMRITVKCEKCGAEVRTASLTTDNAVGCWNTEQARLENITKAAAR